MGVDSPLPHLKIYPAEIAIMILHRPSHFSRCSALYNSILSLGATGVDNGREGIGWERIVGNHAGKYIEFISV